MAMKLKVCMFLPFPRYGENMQVPPQIGICSYLTNFGHEVDWIIWSDDNRNVPQFSFNGVQIFTTVEHHFLSDKSILSRFLNKILNTIMRTRSILKAFNKDRYNFIFVRDDVFDGLAALYINQKYKVPFVFMLSNPLEQNWEYFKMVPEKPYLVYYLVFKFKYLIATFLLHKANLIIPISKWLGENLVAQGIPEAKILPVSEGINVEAFRNKGGNYISEKYHLNNLKIIIYIGTLGKGRCLKLLIQAFSEVKKMREDVKLLIVGEGDDKEALKKISGELGINDDVIFTGQVPQAEIPSFIAASDIGVSPVPPFSFYKMSSPIKMFEYMAMSKPVIANEEIPEHKEVLEQSGGGMLVQFIPEAFAKAIIRLLDNPEMSAEMGQRGQNWVMKNRTYERMARRVEEKLFNIH